MPVSSHCSLLAMAVSRGRLLFCVPLFFALFLYAASIIAVQLCKLSLVAARFSQGDCMRKALFAARYDTQCDDVGIVYWTFGAMFEWRVAVTTRPVECVLHLRIRSARLSARRCLKLFSLSGRACFVLIFLYFLSDSVRTAQVSNRIPIF